MKGRQLNIDEGEATEYWWRGDNCIL